MAKVYINNTHNSFKCQPSVFETLLIDLEKGEKLGKSFWKDTDRKPSRETNGEEERKKGKKKRAIRGGNGEGSRKKGRDDTRRSR